VRILNGGCHAKADCENYDGFRICRCKAGYEGSGIDCAPDCGDALLVEGEECDDGNASDNDGCSFECRCEAGLTPDGTGRCKDLDECATGAHNCADARYCQNKPGGFSCQCPAGTIDHNNWPPPLAGATFTYDPVRRITVLFGGMSTSVPRNQTWLWNGGGWLEVPMTTPPGFKTHAMSAFDTANVIVCGGQNEDTDFDPGCRVFTGTEWTPVSSFPETAFMSAMAYDFSRRRVVAFGGKDATPLDKGWEFDGSAWTSRTYSTRPSARSEHALVYDTSRNVLVLFGGLGGGNALDDTWEYNGTSWSQKTASPRPPGRRSHRMAFDTARNRVVMHGGIDTNDQALGDIWEWDGSGWARITPIGTQAPPISEHGWAYDQARQKFVRFGGRFANGDVSENVWEWSAWAGSWTQILRAETANTSCGDIDECAVGPRICSSNADCTNTFGGVTCTCQAEYSGDGFICSKICSSDAECGSPAKCDLASSPSICRVPLTNGASCVANSQCSSGFCIDKYCCDSACGGACETCNIPGSEGDCLNPTGGACFCEPNATQSCGSDIGECRKGTITCNPDGTDWGACEGGVDRIDEVCGNSKDDDCDTLIDDGCPP